MKRLISTTVIILAIFPGNHVLFSQWQLTTTGTETYSTTALASQGGNLFAAAYTFGVYCSTDQGATWAQRSAGLTDSTVTALTSDGTNLYVGTEKKGVFRTIDNGLHWTPANTGISYVRILSLCSHYGTIYAGTYGSGLFRSTDQGSSWQFVNTGIPYSDFPSLATSDSGIFAGTYPADVIRSTDNGTTWKSLYLPASGWVKSILLAGSTILASTDGTANVYRSTNMGTNWIDSDSGMSSKTVCSFAKIRETIFAGTYWGFYVSPDTGRSWQERSTGLFDLTIYAVTLDSTWIFAGGYGKGVWRRPLSEVVTEVSSNDPIVPYRVQLAQNFPNPFNPSTTISFDISFPSFVSLKVYDFLGREVSTILDSKIMPGHYSFKWTPANASSGVYYYRLQGDGFVETKRLLLVR